MDKQKKLYQKVNVKPKKFGNQNTNAINIIINPDENEEMYNKNPSSRPNNSSILNTIQQQPREVDPSSMSNILNRANRQEKNITAEDVQNLQNEQVNQEQLNMIRMQEQLIQQENQLEQMKEEALNRIEELRELAYREESERVAEMASMYELMEKNMAKQLEKQEDRMTAELNDVRNVMGRVKEEDLNKAMPAKDELEPIFDEVEKLETITKLNKGIQNLNALYDETTDLIDEYNRGDLTFEQLEALFNPLEDTRKSLQAKASDLYSPEDFLKMLSPQRSKTISFIKEIKRRNNMSI